MAIAFSSAASPALDPVVYLEGGPGASPIEPALAGIFDHILAERDLILLDQRGTGHSSPSLACPEVEQVFESGLDALRACRDRLSAEGVALDAYDTAANAADVEDLRLALGYPEWNVYGISYGTRLGLSVLRDHPTGIRSMIVDGVLPLEANFFVDTARNAERSFGRVFEACAAHTACAASFPGLRDEFFTLLARLEQTPAPLLLDEGIEILLSGAAVVRILFQALYSATAIRFVPVVISSAVAGDYEFFRLVLSEIAGASGVSYGMYYSVMCADELAFSTPEELALVAAAVDPAFARTFATSSIFDECGVWNVSASSAVENEPVSASVRGLVLSGEFDPITPPAYGALVAAELDGSRSFTLADQAHGASVSVCGAQLVTGFLNLPSGGFNDSCVGGLALPDFRTARSGWVPRVDFVTSRARPPRWLSERVVAEARRRPAEWLSLARLVRGRSP